MVERIKRFAKVGVWNNQMKFTGLSRKFLSCYKEIIDARHFLFYITFAELRAIHFVPLK